MSEHREALTKAKHNKKVEVCILRSGNYMPRAMASNRAKQEALRKRRNNLFKRIDEISKEYDIQTYFVMKKGTNIHYYLSDGPDWPLSLDDIVRQQ